MSSKKPPFEPRIFVAAEAARPAIDFEGDLPAHLAALAEQLSDDAKHLSTIYSGHLDAAVGSSDSVSLTDVAASSLAYSAQTIGEHSLSSRSSAVMAGIIVQAEQLTDKSSRHAHRQNRFVGNSVLARSLIASLLLLAAGVWTVQSWLSGSPWVQLEPADSLAKVTTDRSAEHFVGPVDDASGSTSPSSELPTPVALLSADLQTGMSNADNAPHNVLEGLSASEQEGVLDLLEQQASQLSGLSI
ncbi:MAG: hypothetical protein SGJ20_01700 [Planctomycetota bacterium]|nr:hypothetical protein [Planctomycetota bacterium]